MSHQVPRASTSSMSLRSDFVAVKVFLLELLVFRMIVWEHFPQHLYTVNIVSYTPKNIKMPIHCPATKSVQDSFLMYMDYLYWCFILLT